MIHIIFTPDYEIHGNGVGSPMKLMVEPTYRNLDLFENYGAKLTIMAEVVEILKFKEYFETQGKDDYHYNDIIKQLKYAVIGGHDVQLHLHPTYFNAQLKNGVWEQDPRSYILKEETYDSLLMMIKQTKDFLMAKMHDYPYEVFAALLLDSQHRIICFHEFFFGSINSAAVHPRVIAQKVLSSNAAAIILVHNHPSGDPTASISDKKITEKIVSAMHLIDVQVLDHFIIGHGKSTSFAEKGWI